MYIAQQETNSAKRSEPGGRLPLLGAAILSLLIPCLADCTPDTATLVDMVAPADMVSPADMVDARRWIDETSGTSADLFAVWSGPAGAPGVFAVGAGGTILHRDAGGWHAQASGTTKTLYAVWGGLGPMGMPPGANFAAGEDGVALKTSDGGATWQSLTVGTTETLYAGYTTKDFNVTVVGETGTVFHSLDGGATFSASTSGTTARLYGAWSDSNFDFVAVGAMGTILRSSDDSKTFAAEVSGVQADLHAVQGGFAVGDSGVLLRGQAKGSWTAITSGTSAALWGTGGASNEMFAVGEQGTILHSRDLGATWAPQASGTMQTLRGVTYDADPIAVGAGGTILRLTALPIGGD